MITKENVVEIAKTYIGTPFHHLGRIKEVGIDCIGVILGVAEELKISLIIPPEAKKYGRKSKHRPLLECMEEQFIWVKKREVGSIVVSWFNSKTKEPSHLGIVTNVGLIHTNGNLGVVIEEHWSPLWTLRIVEYYKYPGVE